MSDYMEETGDPFTGKKKEELKKFLEYMGLTYDEQITHSIVLRKEKEIIATASCSEILPSSTRSQAIFKAA